MVMVHYLKVKQEAGRHDAPCLCLRISDKFVQVVPLLSSTLCIWSPPLYHSLQDPIDYALIYESFVLSITYEQSTEVFKIN